MSASEKHQQTNGTGAHVLGKDYTVPAPRAEWIAKRRAEAAR